MQQNRINISAPNLLNICVDSKEEGIIRGRLYHCYQRSYIPFSDVVELIREAENLFDAISFPQASTKSRSFDGNRSKRDVVKDKPEKVQTQQEIIANKGTIGTFIIAVRFRQCSTWQGDVHLVEKEETKRFFNILELIKIMDL